MFAIIDIETCGGRFEYKRGRVTEICIFPALPNIELVEVAPAPLAGAGRRVLLS